MLCRYSRFTTFLLSPNNVPSAPFMFRTMRNTARTKQCIPTTYTTLSSTPPSQSQPAFSICARNRRIWRECMSVFVITSISKFTLLHIEHALWLVLFLVCQSTWEQGKRTHMRSAWGINAVSLSAWLARLVSRINSILCKMPSCLHMFPDGWAVRWMCIHSRSGLRRMVM